VASARDVLRYPAVRRYLWSTAFAAVGLNILVTVLFKQAFDISGNELDIAWIGLAQFVPAVLLFLVSGWVADRFDRRRVTALFLLGRVACAVALVVYSQIEPGTLWPLFLIAFAFGAVDAMISPARRSIAPLIADQSDFPHVVALWTATFTASAIVGPVLGGFLYSIGPSTAYALAAVLELAAIIPILMITYRREQDKLTERPTLSKALEGLHFVGRTPVVLATISLDLFAVLFGGAIALIPAVAEEQLHVGDIAYGWLRAAPGIGAAVMAVWLAVRPIRRRVGPTLLVVVAIFGLGTMVFGLTSNYALAFVALVVISAADMISMYIRGSIVPLVTPNDQLGRVTAVEGVFIGASNELGAFESGVAARVFGLPLAIAGGGFITVAIAGTFAVVFPSLRRIDTFDELHTADSVPVAV
jgi:MFS family permease